jgi:type I restriction enzyme S subunit
VSDWTEVELGDVLTLQRGFDLPARERIDGPVPIVSSSGVTGSHNESKVTPPGIVIGRYGSLGQVHWIETPFWPLNTSLWVKDFKGNDPRFLSYLLRTLTFDGSTASAVPGVNRNHLHTLAVRRPPVSAQRRIAAVLCAFDELIEINERRIELLEDLARLLYREWFVRFRFPGHEDLELVESELGRIPRGWAVVSVSDACTSVLDGDWIETKDQGGNAYRLLQVSNIGVGAFRETGHFRHITEETYERLRCTSVEVGDILVSRMPDPIGRAWLVDDLSERAITAVDVAILRPASSENGVYLNYWLNAPETLAHAEAVATGTTRKRVSRSVLAKVQFVMPSRTCVEHFARMVKPLRDQRTALIRAQASLAATRDLLLPRLVTGRLVISDIDLGDLSPADA